MRNGYSQKRIKDICRKESSNVAQKELKGLSGKYPIYGASGLIQYVNFYHQENEYIGIVKDGSGVGRIMFLPPKSSVIGTLQYILPKDGYNIRYIGYCLQSLNLASYNQGATIPHIYFRDYGETNIFVADDVAEQQRIVEILDVEFAKIDALRANATKSLQADKDLFQSALKQELQPKEGWKSYKLQDVCTEYGTYGMSLPSKGYDGIRYLRITDITEWGELNNEKVSADTKNIDDKYLLHDGDILFARTGATVGKTLVYNNTMGKCSYAGYLIRYRPNQEIILPQVLYYITHSKFYYNWVMTTQKSTTLPNISAKLYNKYEFSIPISLAEQTRIVSRLDQLNERCKTLQENYDRTITLCEDLKQALLRKAFNGEL